MTTKELKRGIRSGPYAWPGGYPIYLSTTDGGVLCFPCAKKEYRQIYPSVKDHLNDGWTVESFFINWEGSMLYCDHCGERLESAYAED